jgi:hypothetical protein
MSNWHVWSIKRSAPSRGVGSPIDMYMHIIIEAIISRACSMCKKIQAMPIDMPLLR